MRSRKTFEQLWAEGAFLEKNLSPHPLEDENMNFAVVLQGTLEVIETDGGRLPPAILIGGEDLGDEVVRLCRLDKLELSRGHDGMAPGKWILTLVKYA